MTGIRTDRSQGDLRHARLTLSWTPGMVFVADRLIMPEMALDKVPRWKHGAQGDVHRMRHPLLLDYGHMTPLLH